MKYTVHSPLAAAYKGKDISERTLLTHACIEGETSLCGRVKHLCDEEHASEPTCIACLAKLRQLLKRQYGPMDKATLRARVTATGSFYFSRLTMSFFGDTMANYSVSGPVKINTSDGARIVWVLSRKEAVKHGMRNNAYFDVESYAKVSRQEDKT